MNGNDTRMNGNDMAMNGNDTAVNGNDTAKKVSLLNRYVQSLCGLYSRIARQLNVDRSYVSRVARGERRSAPIEHALTAEFDRIVGEEKA
jgi:hypothetical protein